MKKRRTFVVPLLVMIGTLVAAFVVTQTPSAGANDRQEKLAGAWEVVVTTEIQATTFPALLTFTQDGTVIADEPPSPFETSGHGNWISTGRREVAYTFVALIGSAGGSLSNKLKVVGALRYNAARDTWKGPFRIDVFDANGQIVFSDRGTFSLTRIAVERLD